MSQPGNSQPLGAGGRRPSQSGRSEGHERAVSVKRPRTRITKVDEPVESGRRLGEMAYRRILEGLFDRRISAGSFISQSELMQLLDLPIQPLRDALRVLETEGI